MSRPTVLLVGVDQYVLRACELHQVDAVVISNSGAYDSGRIKLPTGGRLIRVDEVTNVEDVLTALYREGLGDVKFDAVQTTWEYATVTTAVLARALGCRSIDPAVAVHFRDKSLQKARLRAAGIPVTNAVVIPDVLDVTDVPFDFERAVLKPISGGGTTSTSVVTSREELEDASRAFREQKETNRTFLLEEFVQGEEWMAEGIVFGGEVLFFGLGAYTEPCLEAVTSQVPISLRRLDPAKESEAYEACGPVVRAAIAALGLEDGVFHMELFREPDTGRIVFSECAARRGGALTQEQVLAKFNVDLAEAALLCALGRRPELKVDVTPDVVGCVGFYGTAGTVISYPTADELLAEPDVVFAQTYVPPGATLSTKFSASADMLGAVLLTTDTVEEFDKRVVELRTWIDDRLVVAKPHLNSGQRWAWQRANWPGREYRDWLYEGR